MHHRTTGNPFKIEMNFSLRTLFSIFTCSAYQNESTRVYSNRRRCMMTFCMNIDRFSILISLDFFMGFCVLQLAWCRRKKDDTTANVENFCHVPNEAYSTKFVFYDEWSWIHSLEQLTSSLRKLVLLAVVIDLKASPLLSLSLFCLPRISISSSWRTSKTIPW